MHYNDTMKIRDRDTETMIEGVSELILGGGTFSEQYNDDPTTVPIYELLSYAFSHGVTTIDTSPYYGPSELLIGGALSRIRFDRGDIRICTKVGRIKEDVFDYSKENIRFSVLRSLERLLGGSFDANDKQNWYLDVVYLHDVEFQPMENCIEALLELRSLQRDGLIHNIGISGYPVEFLYKLALYCANDDTLGPLDCVLSYCNLNLQNTILLDYYEKFKEDCHVKMVSNASVLSMSLLRSQETRYFHPCSTELQKCADEAAIYTQEQNEDLAELAMKYAFTQWLGKGPTLIGFSKLNELKQALQIYNDLSKNRPNHQLTQKEQNMVTHIRQEIFNTHINETWPSGIH